MDITIELTFQIIYFVFLAVAFFYGTQKLFVKKKPLYFKLFVLACGCKMLEQLITVVLFICGYNGNDLSLAKFVGTFSFALFIVSANRGTLDEIVDDRNNNENSHARLLAYIAPIISLLLIAANVSLNIYNTSLLAGILSLICTLPIIPATYYNLKHLIMPKDELGLLDATRHCNMFALGAQIIFLINSILLKIFAGEIAIIATGFSSNLMIALLVVFAVKGAEKWTI